MLLPSWQLIPCSSTLASPLIPVEDVQVTITVTDVNDDPKITRNTGDATEFEFLENGRPIEDTSTYLCSNRRGQRLTPSRAAL